MLALQNQSKKPSEGKSRRAEPAPDRKDAPLDNPAWQSLAMRPTFVQPKLSVSQPDDPYEQEADRIADGVMRASGPPAPVKGVGPRVQMKCGACAAEEEEEERVHRKAAPGEAAAEEAEVEAPAGVHRVLSSPGEPLPQEARAFMEERLGMGLAHVRLHTDAEAASSARSLNALAYTVGNHVAFAPGAFAPHRDDGRRLLAHELAHVAQQTGGATAAHTGLRVARDTGGAAALQQEREESVRGAIRFLAALKDVVAEELARARAAAAAAGGPAEASRRAHPILNQAGIRGRLQRGRGIYDAQRSLLDPNHPLLGELMDAYASFLGEVREAFDEALALSQNDRTAQDTERAAYGESLLLWLEASPLRDQALAGRTSFTLNEVSASQRQETDLASVLTNIVPYLNLVQPGTAARARAAIDGTRARITQAGPTAVGAPPSRTTATGATQTAADTAIAQIDGAVQTIDRGRVMLRAAIARFDVWLQAPTQPIDVADRVNELFNTRDPGYGRLLRDRLQLMLDNLEGHGRLFAHMHRPGDTSTCATANTLGERPRAYEFVFCHVLSGSNSDAAVLLHELAHAVIPGRGTRASAEAGFPLDRAYAGERLMRRMTTEEALNNAESYSHLVRALAGVHVQSIPTDTLTGCADNAPLLDALAVAQSAHRRAWSWLHSERDALRAGGTVQAFLRAIIDTHLGTPSDADLLTMLDDFGDLQSNMSTWMVGHTFVCAPAASCPADALAFDGARVYKLGTVTARRRSSVTDIHICPPFFALGADDRIHAAHYIVSLSTSNYFLRRPASAWGYATLALAMYRSDFGAPPAANLAEHQAADAAATTPATPTPTPTPTPTTTPRP
jgi:hypothetical protein